MKLVTWNINGLRSIKKPMKAFLDELDADIICFQETKITKDQIESDLALVDGYSSYFSFSQTRLGYSGVATYCNAQNTPCRAQEGLFDFGEKSAGNGAVKQYGDLKSTLSEERLYELDKEGRAIITQHEYYNSSTEKKETLTIINVYCPRADPEKPERQIFKMDFYKMLETRANAILKSGSHVVICGDINTSHRRIDHCDPNDPELFYDNPCREWMDQLLYNQGDYSPLLNISQSESHTLDFTENLKNDSNDNICTVALIDTVEKDLDEPQKCKGAFIKDRMKFVDAFRYFFPNRKEAFTCWNTMKSCRETNYGTRIDYILANVDFHINYMKHCDILPEVYGSDHCPVKADINITAIPALKCPPCCTKYMTEFGGRQQTLSTFFAQKRKSAENYSSSKSPKKSELNALKKTSTKFSVSVSDSKKRKLDGNSTGTKGGKQTKLHFFAQNKTAKTKSSNDVGSLERKKLPPDSVPITKKLEFMPAIEKSVKSKSSDDASKFWKSVLKGPDPPPLCKAHNEPCFLRTVKKEGPNLGKQFYCCRRPDGHKNNPEARCSFFQWKT